MVVITHYQAKNLPIAGIIQPLSLETFGNGYALVMADWGGISLDKYIQQQPLELTEKLAIAIKLADILHDLHTSGVIHKDIKPANILIHPESKQVKLIDFSIASLLPKETQEIQNPNVLQGTLAYLAPEQTGRMNRCIDYRSDFYAQITIHTQIESNQVYIRIRDNGKGMSKDVQTKIFDHLFTTKEVGKGTGLGLAIARQIVMEKHGGSLNLWSELSQGTEFVVQMSLT